MASGQTLAQWRMLSNQPPTSNAALPDPIVVTGSRNEFALSFPSTGSPEIVLSGKLLSYAGGGVTVRVFGAMDGANTGTPVVRMQTEFERHIAGKVLTANDFSGVQVAESTVNNTANAAFFATVGHTDGAQMDSVANNELFRIRIARLNSGLTGTNASGNFRVTAVDIVEV